LSTTNPTCCPDANPGRRGGKPASNRWATSRPITPYLLQGLRSSYLKFSDKNFVLICYFSRVLHASPFILFNHIYIRRKIKIIKILALISKMYIYLIYFTNILINQTNLLTIVSNSYLLKVWSRVSK
jgi:hypothetical protein